MGIVNKDFILYRWMMRLMALVGYQSGAGTFYLLYI